MKLFEAYYLLIFFSLIVASQEFSDYALPGCKDTCGNVKIPYPFGIGANCSINEWYVVDCNYSILFNSSTPYLHALNYSHEIVGVSMENQTITVLTPKPIYSCRNPNRTRMNTTDLGGSPFLLSAPDNIFVSDGYCGNATMMMDDGSTVVTSCTTTTCNSDKKNYNCSVGINCCQTTIPPTYLQSYDVSVSTGMEIKQGTERACGSVFVMDTSSYNNQKYYKYMREHVQSPLPISLLWTLSEDDYDHVNCSCGLGRVKLTVHLGNGTSVDTWKCRSYLSYSGSSYLEDGCHETAVTQYKNDACSKKCRDKCDDSETIYNIDGSVYKDRHKCKRKPGLGFVLGLILMNIWMKI